MERKNIAKLVMLKIICCGFLLFFFLGGASLLVGLSTGSIVLFWLGLMGLVTLFYKAFMAALNKH